MSSHKRSSAERKMAALLDEMNVEYEEQVKIEGHRVDFLVDGRLIVESNGDWFHRLDKWKPNDRKKLGKWKKAGVPVVGVWESRIDKEPERVKDSIMAMLVAGIEPDFWDWAVDKP